MKWKIPICILTYLFSIYFLRFRSQQWVEPVVAGDPISKCIFDFRSCPNSIQIKWRRKRDFFSNFVLNIFYPYCNCSMMNNVLGSIFLRWKKRSNLRQKRELNAKYTFQYRYFNCVERLSKLINVHPWVARYDRTNIYFRLFRNNTHR